MCRSRRLALLWYRIPRWYRKKERIGPTMCTYVLVVQKTEPRADRKELCQKNQSGQNQVLRVVVTQPLPKLTPLLCYLPEYLGMYPSVGKKRSRLYSPCVCHFASGVSASSDRTSSSVTVTRFPFSFVYVWTLVLVHLMMCVLTVAYSIFQSLVVVAC